ncbi:hypothetical protein ACU8NH_09170 [Rhizobium leguminosarum]
MIMHTRKSKSDVVLRKSRLAYGFARRRYGQLCSEFRVGEDNPNYNPELVTLKHIDGTVASSTRLEWMVEYGVPHAALCGVLTGKSKSYKGWMLPKTDPARIGVQSGKSNSQADIKIRYWRHIDGDIVIGHKYTLASKRGLRLGDLSGVICGAHGHHRGWYLDAGKIGWSNKPNRKLGRDDAVYELQHMDGRVAKGDRRQLAGECGIGSRQISSILMKTRKSSFGWMLPSVAASRHPMISAANDNTAPLQLSLFSHAS